MKIVKAVTNMELVDAMAVTLKSVHFRYYLLWVTGISTGLRITDLLSLKSCHVTKSQFDFVESKTKTNRRLELPDNLFLELQKYIARFQIGDEQYLFYSSEKKRYKPMSRQWAHRIIARIARLKGLQSIGAHSMRKIYACNHFAATGSLLSTQRAMGHKYQSTTLIYLSDLLGVAFKQSG